MPSYLLKVLTAIWIRDGYCYRIIIGKVRMGAVLGLFVNQLCTYLRFVCKFRVDEPIVTKILKLDSKGSYAQVLTGFGIVWRRNRIYADI